MPDISKLLLSSKTSIGGYVFDVYTSINHNTTSTITSHPIQYGANISDHKFDEPDQLTFQIGMSDATINLLGDQFKENPLAKIGRAVALAKFGFDKKEVAKMTFKSLIKGLSESRSVNAYSILYNMKVMGTPLTCVTRLKTYDNMVIQSITVDDTNETKYGLRATVTLREILVAEAQIIQANSTAQITQTTDKGSTNALDFDLTSKKAFTSTDFDEFGLGDF